VAAVTLFALTIPAGAPLYAEIYGPDPPPPVDPGVQPPPVEPDVPNQFDIPGPDADSVDAALTDAELEYAFASSQITQFETVTFRAAIIYGIPVDPDQPSVQVSWSNQVTLTADEGNSFEIEPTSDDNQFLHNGIRRPDGGLELAWTWDVTPLVAGEQSLTLSVIPHVVVDGEEIPELANLNKPVPMTVDVHPVKHDFDEVLAEAADMETRVPDDMVVGRQYDVSASMSLAGHANTVAADIQLGSSEDSAAVTIVESSPAAALASTGGSSDDVVRHWTVTPDEPGQIAFVFTATVQGQAADYPLKQEVSHQAAGRAIKPGPSFWEILQQPVLYLGPFVALASGAIGLWAVLKKRKGDGQPTEADESP